MNLAVVAFQLADLLEREDVLFLADDDQQAEALASAVGSLRPDCLVQFLPSSDALPGDVAPASPANVGKRVSALRAVRRAQDKRRRQRIALICSGEAAARRYPAPAAFDSAPPTLRVGDAVEPETLAALIAALGYFPDDRVDEPGEMAVRGSVIDIFPADAGSPARVEIADGRIVSLRAYHAETQLTVDDLDHLEIGRAAEPDIGGAATILEHLEGAVLGMTARADKRRLRFIDLAGDAASFGSAPLDAIDDPSWREALQGREVLIFEAEGYSDIPRFAEQSSPLAAMAGFVRPLLADGRVMVLAGGARDRRFLRPKIARRLGVEVSDSGHLAELAKMPAGAAASFELPIDRGFTDERYVVIAAADVLGSRARIGASASTAIDPLARKASEIRVGDVVIHEVHGVACVAGLEAITDHDGSAGEKIVLEHAGGARRLIALEDADRIWRYGADAEAVTLDRLDGSSWHRRRAAIDSAIRDSAKALAAIAEARSQIDAPVIEPEPAAYERFANRFAFNETADQARAISAVRADLASGSPMDRVVVGDVGYGKTEVALRAAALAALAGYQVVVAAPTTVLVRQHLETFRRRFAGTGMEVASLSRLSTAAEKKAVKAGLADGSLKVVIGTGAVMAKGVVYHRLGLVIIDEEQRFGAADKARLRGSGETHLLTLTATPIPRTLQMALIGLQQLSVIATPPARRQPIRTTLDCFDDTRIRTALLREKARGGQSFVVVPRIEDMPAFAAHLRRIVPGLELVEAHGKLPAAAIDEAMIAFASGRGDILLATNIIEAGLDVPRANTMIVWRADRFGLAQLHQLRGRVGRGRRRGQVILLTDAEGAIAERTLKRLRALATYDQLGAGFEISAKDLDMRGAGDLLGDDQAGHVKLIGTELYQHLLGQALRTARGETVERRRPQLHLGASGYLPESWIPEEDVRLALYVRLARIEQESDLAAFEEELLDRFGPLPPEAERLVAHAAISAAAGKLDVERIDAGPAAIALTPRPTGRVGNWKECGLQRRNGRFVLTEATGQDTRVGRVQVLLEELAAFPQAVGSGP